VQQDTSATAKKQDRNDSIQVLAKVIYNESNPSLWRDLANNRKRRSLGTLLLRGWCSRDSLRRFEVENVFLLKRCYCPIKAESAGPSGHWRFFYLKQKPLPQSNVVSGSHALGFGASDLAGWAVVGQLLYCTTVLPKVPSRRWRCWSTVRWMSPNLIGQATRLLRSICYHMWTPWREQSKIL